MKKMLFTLMALVAMLTAVEAKVIKIKMVDGTQQVFTSSELSAIDFCDDGTLVITTYDGEQIMAASAELDTLEIDDEAVVTDIYPDTLSFDIDVDGIPVNLNTDRAIMKMNYVYPSTDPFGEPITLSGTILIPEEVWSGNAKSEGILMVNHYTKFHRDEAPTISNGELENMLLANPLKPNYIIVESDFYGFGATVRFPQAFMQGSVNARSSLDGLLAARELLDSRGFDYGPLCFNIGYSSGGYDALAAQKLRDMEYADRISFDKTFAGGGPYDVREAYRQYVLIDSTAYNAVPMLLMVSTKETQRLDVDYSEVFQPYICDRIEELVLSKEYSSWPICDSIGRDKKIHEILTAPYCNLESEEALLVQNILGGFNMTNDDWMPDLTQRLYIFHSRSDDYVPIQCARPIISFLASKGFVPSIIPGRTHLQTNFVVPKLGHLSATLIYFIQTLAAVKAWPMMYTNGQLNPLYAMIVNQDNLDIVMTMRQLDAMGFDCRSIILGLVAKLTGAGEGEVVMPDQETVTMMLYEQLANLGLTMQDLTEMSEDSGFDLIQFFHDLIAYLCEQSTVEDEEAGEEVAEEGAGDNVESAPARRAARLLKALDATDTPVSRYEHQLRNWLSK